jgi:type VI secretion system secreted protein VgrG
MTDTPSVTDTPTPTTTPFLPPAIEALFSSEVTPNPAAIFSPLEFTQNCFDLGNYESQTVFENPITGVCAVYSYDQMVPGAQWTALWLRAGELVCYETIPWDGNTGGYGFAECTNPIGGWLAGTYEVQLFVGLEYKTIGQFIVQGDAPTPEPPTPTLSPTVTHTPSVTPTSILAPHPTSTP